MAKSGDSFDCHSWAERMQLASSEEKPGMLFKIWPCRAQHPTAKNHLVPDANSAGVEKPCLT